jgi:DNA-binding transcriptional MerR regulator
VSEWRIDELAQRAGIPVDTIRYYQREGVLPSGERSGRSHRYGPDHLERLERIRALQARRFSLAAIGALLEHDEPGGLGALLTGEEDTTYDFDELVEAAGVDAELARAFADAGVLRDPTDHGRSAYDADDLRLLRAVADLSRLSVPTEALVELGRIYAEEFDRIHMRLVDLFVGFAGESWNAQEFKALFSEQMQRFGENMRRITDYTQQRSMQRHILAKVERDAQQLPPAATG